MPIYCRVRSGRPPVVGVDLRMSSRPDGHDIDSLLTNITLYWVIGAINSSFWPYYAVRHEPWPVPLTRSSTPTAYASFPREIRDPPRRSPSRSSTSSGGPRWRAADTSRHSRLPAGVGMGRCVGHGLRGASPLAGARVAHAAPTRDREAKSPGGDAASRMLALGPGYTRNRLRRSTDRFISAARSGGRMRLGAGGHGSEGGCASASK